MGGARAAQPSPNRHAIVGFFNLAIAWIILPSSHAAPAVYPLLDSVTTTLRSSTVWNSRRGASGHFFVQNDCDGEVFPGPFRRIPLGETTSTAPPRPAPRLTWGSRRVPQMPPHCMHSRLGTPPPDPADRILDPWQSRAPCIPFRIFPAPPRAPGHCRG